MPKQCVHEKSLAARSANQGSPSPKPHAPADQANNWRFCRYLLQWSPHAAATIKTSDLLTGAGAPK